MANHESASIIHKKARVGREDYDARAMSPSKALRLALAKAADQLFDMAVSVTTVEQVSVASNAIQKEMGEGGLLLLLDGANGACGAVHFDAQFAAALIEVQITGNVRASQASTRLYTRTDAAMAAPFVDLVLSGQDEQLGATQEGHIPGAFRFGDKLEDARALSLALEGGWFDLFRLTADLQDGAKTGTITVLLPRHVRQSATMQLDKTEPSHSEASIEQNTLEAHATLDAVLGHVQMPLKDICCLKPGMTISLSVDALGETTLIAPRRHEVAKVVLGQMNGLRAVRFRSLGTTSLDSERDNEAEIETTEPAREGEIPGGLAVSAPASQTSGEAPPVEETFNPIEKRQTARSDVDANLALPQPEQA